MQRKILKGGLLFLLIALLNACSVSKEARGYKKTINGSWILQTITTEGVSGIIKMKVFNEANSECFIGSEWNFTSSNSLGKYMLVDTKKECTPFTRLFRWSIYEPKGEEKVFQFKRLDDKKNSMDNGDGFRLKIVELNDNSLKLKSEIIFEGKTAAIIYNFVQK